MKDTSKTNEELLAENALLKQRFRELELSESDRKRAEEALRESKELYRTFINATPDMVFLKDEQFRHIVANKWLAAFFGKPEGEVVGKSDFELMPQTAAEKCRHTDLEALSSKSIFVSEEIVGDQWYETLKFPVELGQNRVGVGGFIRDTTERKRAEEALRKAEENYRSIFENAIEGIFQTTPAGHYISVNHTLARMFGYDSPEDMMSSKLDIGRQLYISQEQRKEHVRLLDEKGVINNYEARMCRKDGSIFWVSINTRVVRNDFGKPVYFEGFVVDITGRKHAEEELKKREELGKSILKSVPHGLFGVENRIIFFANTAMESVFGWKPEELIGKGTRILFRNEDEWKEYGANLYSWLRKKPLVTFDSNNPFVRKDGKEILCRISVSRIGEELGITNRVVATFEDITDRMQSEQALLKSEERYRMIFNHSPLGIVHFDSKGIIRDYNEKFAQIMGVAKGKIIGFNMLERMNLNPA